MKSSIELPLVTVVTVSLNCEKFIETTIRSVISQTYTNREYIIVDGGSTDGTRGILEQYRSCINHLVSEKDNGIYDAMNKGIRLASSQSRYITFLNAGDVYADNDVIQSVVARRKSPYAHLYGNFKANHRVANVPEKLNQWSLSTNTVCHQACFFRTEAHRKFLYDTQYKVCADYKLLLELIRAGESFEKINIIVAQMDLSGISHTNRALLHAEKKKIRRLFPEVYVYAGIKKGFKQLRRWIQRKV